MGSTSSGTPRSRRQFLRRALATGGLALARPDALLAQVTAQAACLPAPPGERLRDLPLYGAGAEDVPLGQMLGGSGLDARLFTDLSLLAPGRLVTPASDVFVRTAAPPGLAHAPEGWAIRLPGGANSTPTVTAADLLKTARPMGVHLIECAGNSNPRNFGLMSAVAWDGVPLSEVLQRMPRPAGAAGLLVTGADHDTPTSRQSLPGASWVLPPDTLDSRQPFLATGIDGAPLTADHGAPVRLVVPGWYGCAWIKWVREIAWVGPDAESTTQMLEFAFRTHQADIPMLARDYEPPAIDTAAMPVRVEQWRVDGALEYRIVGIVWGGTRPVDRLLLRLGSRDRGTPVVVCPAPATTHTWALWTHRWRPTEPGYYDITLRADDAAIRTRRLDLSFYIRRVKIDEI